MAETQGFLIAGVVIIMLILLVVAMSIGSKTGTGLMSYINKYLPGIGSLFGSGGQFTDDYLVAKYSSQAIACAAASTAAGKELPCVKDYQKPTTLTGGGSTSSGGTDATSRGSNVHDSGTLMNRGFP